MDCVKEKYVYKGTDESYIIIRKIEQIVNLLSEKENCDFDTMYAHFLESNTYRALQETRSLLWYENAEFIVDEYYREKEGIQ
ncbi:hypothetical protein FACS1894124_7260 [Spirochaetia bacterium]|nr:hypothetical protein FACS1894124_7260 [Spirochaetia bacterium]